MAARTKRVAVDQDGDWIFHYNYDADDGAPSPGQDYVVLSQDPDNPGGMPPIFYTADSAYGDITVWANGLISFFPPTQAQIEFMDNLGPDSDVSQFPGDYIAAFFPNPSFEFTIGFKSELIRVVWDGGEVDITPDQLIIADSGGAGAASGFRLNGAEHDGSGAYYLSDLIVVNGSSGGNVINGGPAAETINGLAGNDTLQGGGGGDKLVGGDGNDTLDGGAHNDRLYGGAGDDLLLPGAGQDQIDGGDGIDRVVLDYGGLSGNLDFTLPAGGGTLVDGKTITNVESVELHAAYGDDTLRGGAYDDRLYGGSGYDRLYGGGGNDLLDAGTGGPGGGAALVNGGGAGGSTGTARALDDLFSLVEIWGVADSATVPHVTIADTISGAAFSTTRFYSVSVGADGHLVVDIDGLDTLSGASTSIQLLDAGGNFVADGIGDGSDDGSVTDNDAYLDIAGLTAGTYYIRIDAQCFDIGAVDDYTINVSLSTAAYRSGNLLTGGAGNDIYYVYASGDSVVENPGEGTDTVYAAVSWTLGGDVENLTLTGTGDTSGTGNALDNVLIGNSGNNSLSGGAGADRMSGGAGNDTYLVDNVGDVVNEAADGGYDLVVSGVSYSIAGQYIEALTLTGGALNAIGNSLNNVLRGTEGANFLNGAGGADTMTGYGGNDRYVVDNIGDVVIEANGGGTDRIDSSVSYGLAGTYVETLVLTGAAAIDATGNGQANTLIGNSAANRLDGGGGADTLQGGAGDDRYIVDNAGDKVIELDGQGSDTVESSVSFSLAGQYVEALVLTGGAATSGTGNSLDNRITGNGAANILTGGAGNDRLDGGAGADTLVGGTGNDVYVVDNALDKITEKDGEGTDTVEASIGYSLAGQYIEILKLTGTANIDGNGNSLANTLYGNGGANTLNGAAGADSMYGGAGNDLYVVDNAGDRVFENNGEGTDTVQASVTFSLAGQYVENLVLTGTAAINGTGNSLANGITGNNAANILNGGAGDDRLHGGLGSDTLTGGAGLDSFYFETALGAANVDRITDFSAADDTIILDRTIFSGVAANGALAAAAFWQGSAAHDADDRIVYDKATGKLWYDADGTGAGAAVLFAQVAANTVLTAADFFAVA